MSDQRVGMSRKRWWQLAGGLYLAWLLFGLFALPPLLHQPLVDALEQATGQSVSIEDIDFNPLGLSASLKEVRISGADGEPMIQVPSLYVDFELSSLVRLSVYLDVVEIEAPRVNLVREAGGAFNLVRLGPAETGEPAESQSEDEASSGLFPVSIGNFSLKDGQLAYRDLTGEAPVALSFTPINIELEDFTTGEADDEDNQYQLAVTGPGDGTLSWSGRISLMPFGSTGDVALEEVALSPLAVLLPTDLPLSLPDGKLSLETAYDFTVAEGGLQTRAGALRLADLQLEDRQGREILNMPGLSVGGIKLDLPGRWLNIENISVDGPQLFLRRQASGMHPVSLFATGEPQPGGEADDADNTAGPTNGNADADGKPEDNDAWRLSTGRVVLSDGRVSLADETLGQPASLALVGINASADDLDTASESPFTLSGEARLGEEQGRLQWQGEGQLTPLSLTVETSLEQLALPLLQPWLADVVRMQLNTGQLDGSLNLRVPEAGSPVIDGNLAVAGFDLTQPGGEHRLAWQRLDIGALNIDTDSRRVALDQVEWEALDASLLVDEQGRGSGAQLLVPGDQAAGGQSGAQQDAGWSLTLGRLALTDGAVNFQDRSVSPVYRFSLAELSGDVTDIDTRRAGQSGRLQLNGKVDRYAPLSVKGNLGASQEKSRVAVELSLSGYEMTGLTPYTGRYLGYAVQSGQLNLDTSVQLTGSQLDSNSQIRANNFYLGDRVDSDEAIKAPLKLGMAVMRNSNGVVQLPVGISGDLSNPSVSVRGLIIKAITNVLVKAATSPFSVLAGLAGGENLEYIPYPAGVSQPDEGTRQRLEKLAGVLASRPALKINMAGTSRPQADRRGLALQRLARRLAGDAGIDWQGLAPALENEAFRRTVLAEWEDETGRQRQSLSDGEPSPQSATASMTDKALRELSASLAGQVDEAALRQLASQRAQSAKSILVQAHGVDGARLFLTDPEMDEERKPGVHLTLVAD
jgi:hypothetical protein